MQLYRDQYGVFAFTVGLIMHDHIPSEFGKQHVLSNKSKRSAN
jgi:hypothetical protein